MRVTSKYFYDYRLPTERPFRDALREYQHRVKVISVVVGITVAAALLLALVIVAFQAGYWYIVVIALLILLGGGGGGSSRGPGPPPPGGSGNTGTQKQPDKAEAPQGVREEVLVRAYRPRPKVRMLAIRPEHPDGLPIVIERDAEAGGGVS
jgi:hypothetical protein